MYIFRHIDWRLVLLYAIVGPFVGALAFTLGIVVENPTFTAFLSIIFVVLWAYMYGSIPALLTGLLAPLLAMLLRKHIKGNTLPLTSASVFVGTLTSLVPWLDGTSTSLLLGGLGALSGGVCSLLAYRLGLGLGPNNSFKPNPLRSSNSPSGSPGGSA
jgi:hypothetical protein